MAHIDPIDPAVWEAPAMRRALAARDITTVYRLLRDAGVSQRQLAALVGQSQSEVSEILAGRQVKQYDTLVRIADGLDVERGRMGLAYTTPYTAGDARTPDEQEVTDPVQRRDVFAVGALATLGFVPSFAALLDDSATPAEVPLPSRIGASDVAEVRARTEQLRADARREGGQARTASAAAAHYRRLVKVSATDPVGRELRSALAELDELAGWCCFDSGLDRHARWHYRTAIDLASGVGDDYRVASALRFAGVVDSSQDSPDDAVKLYQLAGVQLGGKGDPDLSAWLHAVTAGALATMGHEQASDELARARDGWSATKDGWRADQSYQSALVYMRLGKLDVAEQLVSSCSGAGLHRPVGTLAGILRAAIHVQTGEPRGVQLAETAIDATSRLRSGRARERLARLETALLTRRDSTCADLARQARAVRLAA